MKQNKFLKGCLNRLLSGENEGVQFNGFTAKLLNNPFVGKIIVIEKDGKIWQRRTVDAAAAIMEA